MAVIGHFHCRFLCTADPALARLDRHSVAAAHRALRAPWAASGRRRLYVGCVRCRFLLIFVKKSGDGLALLQGEMPNHQS